MAKLSEYRINDPLEMVMKICNVAQLLSQTPITYLLVALIFISGLFSYCDQSIFYKMALHPYAVVRKNQYYRFFTSDFAHIDIQHFIVNEASIFFVCGEMERCLRHVSAFGSLEFALIYMASMLTGSVLVVLLHYNDITFSTAGASGSIMGCMFGLIYLEPHKIAIYLPGIGAIKNEYYSVIYIVLMILLKKRIERSGASYELHFWGAIGGIAMTLFIIKFINSG